ncbi:uncharacterized protein L199_000914 [Kwoniella botswanensis]|uniref:uncharacterized protein n=1 Tax=Kwoniella botswanensis TaxID=1268659 RepID=UPI00315C4DE4
MKNGLKSLSRFARDPDASEEIKYRVEWRISSTVFNNDPRFIYTKPVWDGSRSTKVINGRSIVLAARPDSVKVFNAHFRDMAFIDFSQSNTFKGSYLYCSLPYTDLIERVKGLGEGYTLNPWGYTVETRSLRDDTLSHSGASSWGYTVEARSLRNDTLSYSGESLINADYIDPRWIVPRDSIPETLKENGGH